MSATVQPIGGEWGAAVRIRDLPGVDEAIVGLIADPTGDNAAMLVREVMRAVTEGAAGTLAQLSKILTVEGKEPPDAAAIVREVTVSTRMNRELGGIIHDLTAAQQAAWIEWRHGEGAEGGMQWIENTLAGPGLIPGDDEGDEGDPIFKNAQAFFDRFSSWNMQGTPDGTMAGRQMAGKNDRELLDFMGRERVLVDYLPVEESGRAECIVYGHDSLKIIGRAATTREALREAVRALAPQADLFGAGEG